MKRLGETLGAFGSVFANPNLRRIQLGFAVSIIASWAYGIALSVFAYEHGGTAAVGYVNVLIIVPSALAAPFMAILGDRFPRKRVMFTASFVRAMILAGITALFYADAPAPVIYALAVLVAIVGSAFSPARAAIMPALADTPEQLTAANVTSSTLESVGIFLGPALGGLLLAATDAGVVFAVMVAAFLWSALMVSGLRVPKEDEAREAEAEAAREGFGGEALAGFRAIAFESRLRVIVGLFASQTFVSGALTVLIVVIAFRLLDSGAFAVGYLNSAIGVGGLLGSVVALAIAGRRRLAGGFMLGLLMWGIPIALVAIWPHPAFAIVMLALVGIGNTLIDVSAITLMQRTVPDAVLARAFGVLEAVLLFMIAVGSMVAPALVAAFGARGALIATGAVLPALALLTWRRLRAIDAAAVIPAHEVALLRAIPIFAPLPEATVEHLASRLTPLRVQAGDTVIREGDHGDRFYIVSEGGLEASVDGQTARELGPGSYFGEIALLRDVPRTATVTASDTSELFALEREDFLAAVTGHAESREAAEAVITARFGPTRAAMGAR